MTGTKTIRCQISRRAADGVCELLRLEDRPQALWVTLDDRVPCNNVQTINDEQVETPLVLIALDSRGIVIEADPDEIETEEFGGGLHGFRPVFVPWAHVYGMTGYRDT